MSAGQHDSDDAAGLSRVLAEVYASVADPNGWSKALGSLCRYVGGSSALVFHQDYLAKSGDFIHSYNADPEWTRLYFEKYLVLNPVLPFMAFMDIGSTTAFSRLIELSEFQRSQFHREWAAPQRFLDVVVTILDKGATVAGLFAVTFREDDGLASENAIVRMELVAPHVRQAVMLRRTFESALQYNTAFETVVEKANDAVLFLDAEGHLTFANSAARRLSSPDGPFHIRNSRLIFADPDASADFERLLHVASAGDWSAGGRNISFARGADPVGDWVVNLLPITNSSSPGKIAAVIVRRSDAAAGAPPAEAIARRNGFTPRELQVFMGIVQIGGVPAVAKSYGLSSTTVRSHLQRVFDKTGVRRQRDLVEIARKPPEF